MKVIICLRPTDLGHAVDSILMPEEQTDMAATYLSLRHRFEPYIRAVELNIPDAWKRDDVARMLDVMDRNKRRDFYDKGTNLA